jgi:hypothetical protein
MIHGHHYSCQSWVITGFGEAQPGLHDSFYFGCLANDPYKSILTITGALQMLGFYKCWVSPKPVITQDSHYSQKSMTLAGEAIGVDFSRW